MRDHYIFLPLIISLLLTTNLASVRQGKQFTVSIFPYTAQTGTIDEWNQQLKDFVAKTESQPVETEYAACTDRYNTEILQSRRRFYPETAFFLVCISWMIRAGTTKILLLIHH